MHVTRLLIATIIVLQCSICLIFKCLGSEINEDIRLHKNYHLINDQTCGVVYHNRIVGGKNASLGQFPWMVQIRFGFGEDKNFNSSSILCRWLIALCGGAIVNNLYVLSAAHCFPDTNSYTIGVVLGEHTTNQDPDCELDVCAPRVQCIAVETIILHLDHDDVKYLNDIALLRLRTPIKFNDYVKPICLVTDGQVLNFTNEYAEVAGWGDTRPDKLEMSNVLQTLKFTIRSEDYCSYLYRRAMEFKNISTYTSPKLICIGNVTGQDTCRGDSGAPAMKVLNKEGQPRYFVIGTLSAGTTICGNGHGAFFTDVSRYIRWILDNIKP